MKAWILAVATMAATPAAAERYALVSIDDPNGKASSIDMDSIRTVNGNPRAWVLLMMGKEATAPNHVPGYVLSLTEFDCKQQRIQVLSSKVFRESGAMLHDLGPTPWSYAVPRTVNFDTLEYGCGKVADEKDIVHLPANTLFKMYRVELEKMSKE